MEKNMKLLSINIGKEKVLQTKNGEEITGIHKFPARGPVQITELGIAEDFIGSPKHHGGPDQALYVYGEADYQWWEKELDQRLKPGIFGENLTISGLESATVNVGDFLYISDVALQVTAPRIPCSTFASHMQDPQWVKKFRAAERPGFYCRVLQTGTITAGDDVRMERFTGETISIAEIYRDHYEKRGEELLRRQLNAPISMRLRARLERDLQALLEKQP
jgi:MOSC domain-containing protein YiiM